MISHAVEAVQQEGDSKGEEQKESRAWMDYVLKVRRVNWTVFVEECLPTGPKNEVVKHGRWTDLTAEDTNG